MKLLVLLLFILPTKGHYDCTQLTALEQINYSGITMSKTNDHYRVSLCLSSDSCLFENKNVIKCDDICDSCEEILSTTECTDSKSTCEQHVDRFLNDYYMNATFRYCETCSSSTQDNALPITTTSEATEPSVAITPTTEQCTCTCNESRAEANTLTSATVLGVLVALLVVALAVVTTGWVWTCCLLKRRSGPGKDSKSKQNYSQSTTNCSRSTDAEICYTNPTYGETSEPQTATVNATYDAINPNCQITTVATNNGQTYNILNRDQPQGHNDITNIADLHGNRDYSHLYNVLEKPTNDDYEDPDNENGVTEYEIPETLNEK